jgi:hypothetical protein
LTTAVAARKRILTFSGRSFRMLGATFTKQE